MEKRTHMVMLKLNQFEVDPTFSVSFDRSEIWSFSIAYVACMQRYGRCVFGSLQVMLIQFQCFSG